MTDTTPQDGQTDRAKVDLEGRVVVLEIVSMTALALAMDTSETADVDHARGIARLIMETVHQRCGELKMPDEARLSACSYADELLSTAMQSLYPGAPQQH
ncbi:hypothetical protein M0654_18860 [Rhizobium sp. NTR19]|uniref:Uncharacterized protein n=1 Tax=Neorhizobium turbinariae TaxID=2937795 RepID=A0ABT0IW04_9HYPH|nr:hypothetical protein [Neorhizobium turbinariae]MCK8782044.1 hypothetical protein [Neorhizobium turbinariae]